MQMRVFPRSTAVSTAPLFVSQQAVTRAQSATSVLQAAQRVYLLEVRKPEAARGSKSWIVASRRRYALLGGVQNSRSAGASWGLGPADSSPSDAARCRIWLRRRPARSAV